MATDRQQLYQKRDRLRQLQAFCCAAKFGSMTRAAEQLLISQPAVSLHVRELEHELDTVLFERNGPRIALSPAGERFYQLAAPLVEGMDGLEREFARESDDLDSGEVRVASGDAGANFVLPRVIGRLRRDHPGIRVHLRACRLGVGLDLLLAEDVELVLGFREPVSTEFEYRPVLSYDFVLITPRDHPLAGRNSVTPEALANSPLVVPDSVAHSPRAGQEPLRRFDIEANVAIEVGGWDVVEHYVAAGLGVAFYPSFCVSEGSGVSVVPLDQYYPKRSYGRFTRLGKPLSRPAQRLVEALEAEYPGGE